jgi:hypothetical protein
MGFPKQFKSKKTLLGLGAVVVIGVGFFMFQLMSSGVTEKDVPRIRSKSSPRAAVKTTPKPKMNEQTQSPLFEAMEALKDPFRTEDPKTAELESKLSITQKEIAYLKATLEEKKLRQEIREIERSLSESEGEGSSGGDVGILSSGEEGKPPEERVEVKAILTTDEGRSALLTFGPQRYWVHEGERFAGWQVHRIREESVVLIRDGRVFVFFYDRPGVMGEGES